MQLQQRCWIMHWALFLLGNHSTGRSVVCDMFLQDRYLQAIQTNAPHLLRYLAVAVITNPRRRDKMRDLVRVIGMERVNFSDPITQLLEDLHTHANFEHAQDRLKDCAVVLDNDLSAPWGSHTRASRNSVSSQTRHAPLAEGPSSCAAESMPQLAASSATPRTFSLSPRVSPSSSREWRHTSPACLDSLSRRHSRRYADDSWRRAVRRRCMPINRRPHLRCPNPGPGTANPRYCRIHERIDLTMLAEKLGMEQIAAEKWIVKMVSDAQLNAKIDSQSGHVILGVQPPDVYQQVIEKTKGLSFRSYVLAQNIEKRANALARSNAMAASIQ